MLDPAPQLAAPQQYRLGPKHVLVIDPPCSLHTAVTAQHQHRRAQLGLVLATHSLRCRVMQDGINVWLRWPTCRLMALILSYSALAAPRDRSSLLRSAFSSETFLFLVASPPKTCRQRGHLRHCWQWSSLVVVVWLSGHRLVAALYWTWFPLCSAHDTR